MKPSCHLTPAERVQWDAGPYSYTPGAETPREGRTRGAILAAAALDWAHEAGIRFQWAVDPDVDSSDFSDDPEPWAQWECLAYDESGQVVAAIGAVDFGRDGEPWGDDYARSVEADLAMDAFVSATRLRH